MKPRRLHWSPWQLLSQAVVHLVLCLIPPLLLVAAAAIPVAAAQTDSVSTGGIRLDEGRFTVVADRRDERLARTILRLALERDTFPGLPRPRLHALIAIAPDANAFRAWSGNSVGTSVAGYAVPAEQRVVLKGAWAGGDTGEPGVVLRHELAHLALHETMGDLPPRWFDEGYADLATGDKYRTRGFETSVSMVWRTLPSVSKLDAGFEGGATESSWAYSTSYLAVSELAALGGERALANFFVSWKSSGSFEMALRQAYGMTGEAFDKHWHRQARRRYGALSVVTSMSLVAGFFSLLLAPMVIGKRRRDRARLEAMRASEARQEARQKALDEALRDALRDTMESQLKAGVVQACDMSEVIDAVELGPPENRQPGSETHGAVDEGEGGRRRKE